VRKFIEVLTNSQALPKVSRPAGPSERAMAENSRPEREKVEKAAS